MGQRGPKPGMGGRPKKAIAEKIADGNPGKRKLTVIDFRDSAALISPQLLERHAMSVARWIQCETATTEFGFLAKHPTTGAAIQSPYVWIYTKKVDKCDIIKK